MCASDSKIEISSKLETNFEAFYLNRSAAPDMAMVAARKSLEAIVNVLCLQHLRETSPRADLGSNIRELGRQKAIPEKVATQMHSLRLQTNASAHDHDEPRARRDVEVVLVLLSCVTEWFAMSYALYYDGLIEFLERMQMLEQEHLDATLKKELEDTRKKLRETEEFQSPAKAAEGRLP